jgi:uncharacterized RmlC-like cupin family protein
MSGIKVIRPSERDRGAVQTTGMVREAGISHETAGTNSLWSGYVRGEPGMASGVHHHGDCETAIYVINGRARFYFGPQLEQMVEVQGGDFLFVPPNEVHMEENLSATEPLELIVSRGCSGILTINVPDPRQPASNS